MSSEGNSLSDSPWKRRSQHKLKPSRSSLATRRSIRLSKSRRFSSVTPTPIRRKKKSTFQTTNYSYSSCDSIERAVFSSLGNPPDRPTLPVGPFSPLPSMTSTNKLSTELNTSQIIPTDSDVGKSQSRIDDSLLAALKKQMETNNSALKIIIDDSIDENSKKLRAELKR